MTNMFGIAFLGCLLSTILQMQFSAVDASAGSGYNCSTIATELDGTSCEAHLKWNGKFPNDLACITQILESKRKYDPKKHQAYTNLTSEYCSDTTEPKNCSDCLSKAFYDFYNRSHCFYADTSHIDRVKDCLLKYNSSKFDWSRKVIFEEYRKAVNLSSEPYQACSFKPSDIPKNKTIVFPVYLRLAAEFYDKILNTLLSLFLEAFEVQNGDNSTGVTCQHINDTRLLFSYKFLYEKEINKPPLEVRQSYSNLRVNMCEGNKNESSCVQCFNETDETFLFHVYNEDAKASSIRKDFLNINASLHKCLQTFPSQNYSSLWNLTRNLRGSWNASFANCLNAESKKDLKYIEKNNKTIEYIGHAEAVVRSVGLNYYGFHIYQNLQTNKSNYSCVDVDRSLIICTAWKTIQSITVHSGHNSTEDKQLEYLGLDIGGCGKPIPTGIVSVPKKGGKNKKNKKQKN